MKENSTKIAKAILQSSFTEQEVMLILDALKIKNYISYASMPSSSDSRLVNEFITEFWDYEKSPYVKEKKMVGQSIHKRYCTTNLCRCKRYIFDYFEGRTIGSVTKEDIKTILENMISKPQKLKGQTIFLSAETVNQTIRAVAIPLRWAYRNNMISKDCTQGIMFCKTVHQKRKLLTQEQIKLIFSARWKHDDYKLANLISLCTGMRMGEIQALQLRDIQNDTIFVRHSWARMEGLKSTKNGEDRIVKVPPFLVPLLKQQIDKNPFNTQDSYLFFSDDISHPCNARHWTEELQTMIRKMGIPNSRSYTFHAWRHYFSTTMADHTSSRKVQLLTGHKSDSIFLQYSNHQILETLDQLQELQTELFTPLINNP